MDHMRHPVPLSDFTDAMLDEDDAFAAKVTAHEARFGTRPGTRAVAAQAAYNCWFHVEYRENLREICRAIGSGAPTSLALCGQVTGPQRALLDAYVVGLRSWLGHDLGDAADANGSTPRRVREWLGDDHMAKRALVDLLLCGLVDSIESDARVSVLGDVGRDQLPPSDASLYRAADGSRYTLSAEARVDREKDAARQHIASHDAEELIAGVVGESQPPCMHRYERYLAIRITSIGALRWRGALPADDGSKEQWQSFWSDAEDALRRWAAGEPCITPLGAELSSLLGVATEERRAIVLDFLLKPPPGTAFWAWLSRRN